jgi:hypothetical protein
MQAMDTTRAWLWFCGGIGLLLVLIGLAIGVVGKTPRPPEAARTFFTKDQYAILFPGAGLPQFDPQHPNPKLVLSRPQKGEKTLSQTEQLTKWGFNDCVQTDGLTDQQTGPLDGACFCENAPAVKAIFAGNGAVQPQNTYSTFFLSMVGLVILGLLVFRNPPPQQNFMTVMYFFALCYAYMTIALGPLSMALHFGLSSVGGWFDSLSLYVWFSFVMCYGWFRFFMAAGGTQPYEDFPWWGKAVFGGVWFVAILVPAIMTYPGVNGPISSDIWYLILGGLALGSELALLLGNLIHFLATDDRTPWAPAVLRFDWPPSNRGSWWFLWGVIAFALALTIWALSFTQKPLCAPHAIQGHAIFHTLSAVAAGCLYFYYRHEGEAATWW